MPHLRAMLSAATPCDVRSYVSRMCSVKGKPATLKFEPIGTRDMTSTPPPIATSTTPDEIRFAAKWIACWPEPHCRSTVVPGTSIGKPASSDARCGRCSRPARRPATRCRRRRRRRAPGRCRRASTTSRSTFAPSVTGCVPESMPFRRPIAVRTASTMTTSVAKSASCLLLVSALLRRLHSILTAAASFRLPPCAEHAKSAGIRRAPASALIRRRLSVRRDPELPCAHERCRPERRHRTVPAPIDPMAYYFQDVLLAQQAGRRPALPDPSRPVRQQRGASRRAGWRVRPAADARR